MYLEQNYIVFISQQIYWQRYSELVVFKLIALVRSINCCYYSAKWFEFWISDIRPKFLRLTTYCCCSNLLSLYEGVRRL